MVLVGEHSDFKVYFDCRNQVYNVYRNNKFFIGNKYKFSDVKSYLS